MLVKAFTLGADEVIVDLEDAVPAQDKDAARTAAREVLRLASQRPRCAGRLRVPLRARPWGLRAEARLLGNSGSGPSRRSTRTNSRSSTRSSSPVPPTSLGPQLFSRRSTRAAGVLRPRPTESSSTHLSKRGHDASSQASRAVREVRTARPAISAKPLLQLARRRGTHGNRLVGSRTEPPLCEMGDEYPPLRRSRRQPNGTDIRPRVQPLSARSPGKSESVQESVQQRRRTPDVCRHRLGRACRRRRRGSPSRSPRAVRRSARCCGRAAESGRAAR